MKDLIIADIIRILQKPALRIVYLLLLLATLIYAIRSEDGMTFISNLDSISGLLAEQVLGIVIFISVFADEFSSNSMQCLIGRGISRFRLLCAKILDSFIITFICFGIFAIYTAILMAVFSLEADSDALLYIFSEIFTVAVKTMGISTFAMIILFWTKKIAYATVLDYILLTFSSVMGEILTKIPVIKFMHLENRLFGRAVECAQVSLVLGDGTAVFLIIWELIKISVISLVITYLLFRKKELDF